MARFYAFRSAVCSALLLLGFCNSAHADLFVSSQLTGAINRYDEVSGALIGVIPGAPPTQSPRPVGLVFAPNRDLLVANMSDAQVYKFNQVTGVADIFFFNDFQYGAQGMAFGPGGYLYLGNQGAGPGRIGRFDASTGAMVSNFGYEIEGNPEGLTFAPNGDLLVAVSGHGNGDDTVQRFNPTSGEHLGTFASGLSGPVGIAFGPDGNLYVASNYDDTVLRFDGLSGMFIDTFVAPGSGGLDLPWGIAFGQDGNLYVASTGTDSVLRYDGTTGAFLGTFAAGPELSYPTYLAFDTVALYNVAAIPEPETYAMLLAGLGLLGFAARRRKLKEAATA